jgi:hypothetical protein
VNSTWITPLTVLAATLALVIGTSRTAGRMRRRREEKRIARGRHLALRIPARFHAGLIPSHEDAPMTPLEEREFQWITEALKGAQRARNQ